MKGGKIIKRKWNLLSADSFVPSMHLKINLSSLQWYYLNSFTKALAFLAKCSQDRIQLCRLGFVDWYICIKLSAYEPYIYASIVTWRDTVNSVDETQRAFQFIPEQIPPLTTCTTLKASLGLWSCLNLGVWYYSGFPTVLETSAQHEHT